MKKWKCLENGKKCGGKEPCIIDAITTKARMPERCPYGFGSTEWEEVAAPQLPKLTAEVFNRPDCPAWAKFAAADENGCAYWFRNKPFEMNNGMWGGGANCRIDGRFDASDWQHSLIERPAKREFKVGDAVRVNCDECKMHGKICRVSAINQFDGKIQVEFPPSAVGWYAPEELELVEPANHEEPPVPDWCKVGAWVWISMIGGNGIKYRKIKAIDNTGWINFSGGFCDGIKNAGVVFIQARIRPWTFEEAPETVRVVEGGARTVLYLSNEVVSQGTFFYFSMQSRDTIDAEWMSKNMVQLDGSPCGVLEHIEDGKWVE